MELISSTAPGIATDLRQYIKNFKSVAEFCETSWRQLESNCFPEPVAEKLIALLAYIDLSSKLQRGMKM